MRNNIVKHFCINLTDKTEDERLAIEILNNLTDKSKKKFILEAIKFCVNNDEQYKDYIANTIPNNASDIIPKMYDNTELIVNMLSDLLSQNKELENIEAKESIELKQFETPVEPEEPDEPDEPEELESPDDDMFVNFKAQENLPINNSLNDLLSSYTQNKVNHSSTPASNNTTSYSEPKCSPAEKYANNKFFKRWHHSLYNDNGELLNDEEKIISYNNEPIKVKVFKEKMPNENNVPIDFEVYLTDDGRFIAAPNQKYDAERIYKNIKNYREYIYSNYIKEYEKQQNKQL